MAKFSQVPQSFLFRKLLTYWGNMVRNYKGECRDNDFFDIVRNGFDHEKGVELIEAAYSKTEIEAMCGLPRHRRLDLGNSLDDIFQSLWNNERSRSKCRAVLECICEYLLAGCDNNADDALKRRFEELVHTMKLSELEAEILMAAYVRAQTCFNWPCRIEDREKPLYYAMAVDRSYAEVSAVMSPSGRLKKFGLLDDDWDFNGRTIGAFMVGTTDEAISRRFYANYDRRGVLPWEFFGDISEKDGRVICDLIAASKGKCNILFYGEPGTGKTSFARAVAKRLHLTAYEVKQGEDDGSNMSSESRMIGIQIANYQEDPNSSLLIVDEADELLRGNSYSFDMFGFDKGGKSTEKGVMNAILDEMKLPGIWICNAPADQIDESVRRRFSYSVRFDKMNSGQRKSIWRNLLKKYKLCGLISDAQIEDYAVKYQTSAGGIAMVLENVRRLRPRRDKVDGLVATFMKPHCELMGIKDAESFLPAKGYSLEGLNVKGKVSPTEIIRAMRNYYDADYNRASEDRPRMNVLMFGPPGTGKTELVRYMGKELDRKVLVVKGSDILSKWVGGSEANIAAAFRRAEAEKSILFFDEIDGLVQSRENAKASWEVSQVNELLQQMENFNGIMIAATNFSKNLDPAIMRRFTFKCEFDFLDTDGKQLFFERTFNTRLSSAELHELDELQNLTPGDFRTVRQAQFYLAEQQDNESRIAALRQECEMKDGGRRAAKIGFAARHSALCLGKSET